LEKEVILESFRNRFTVLKSNGVNIQYVLDIGAYRGDFTETIHAVWPTAIVRQIEADDRQQGYLNKNAIIALLGNTSADAVDFYTLGDNKITTGSSIYKELTPHYTENTTVVIPKSMTTIDILAQEHNFFGNWKELGLIKIDTQGSELLILEGATNFLAEKQPKFILLECSVIPYNQGSPIFAEAVEKMNKLKYTVKDIFDLSYNNQNQLLQTDILFERVKE
jgi:FkbM family methyltransferase